MSQSMVHPARCAKTRSFGNKVHIALRDIQKCKEQGSLWKRLTNAFTRSERRSGKIQRNRLHQTHSKQVRSCPELSQAHSQSKIQKRYQDDVTGVSLIQYHNPISSSGSVKKRHRTESNSVQSKIRSLHVWTGDLKRSSDSGRPLGLPRYWYR